MLDEGVQIGAEEEDVFYEVPDKSQFNTFQWVCLGVMYFFAAFLFGFIVYISCTWNKPRINEYT